MKTEEILPMTWIFETETKGLKTINNSLIEYGYRIKKVKAAEAFHQYKLYVQKQCWDDRKSRYKWVTIPENVAWNQLMALFS